jgi:hypothetical protein
MRPFVPNTYQQLNTYQQKMLGGFAEIQKPFLAKTLFAPEVFGPRGDGNHPCLNG